MSNIHSACLNHSACCTRKCSETRNAASYIALLSTSSRRIMAWFFVMQSCNDQNKFMTMTKNHESVQHTPLDSTQGCIRLIEILPQDTSTDLIRCDYIR